VVWLEELTIVIVVIAEVTFKPRNLMLINVVNLIDQLEPNAKFVWGNISASCEIPNFGMFKCLTLMLH